jgi:serine/threonine protein kinase
MILQVVKLQDLSVKQKQRMYLRFTKELFILHQLQHERIVPVYACASTLDEVTLVMKVIQVFYTANNHVVILL